jgi:peptidoglycan/LPS O-acetylase OafA/YrhL
MWSMASGRPLLVAMLVLIVCDVIGGFLAVFSGLATWGEAWGFDTKFTVPLPVGAAQLFLAWLAARNVRPPVGLVAAVILSVFCLISLMFGLFDGDLTNEVASAGFPGGVVWGVVLLAVTAVVGVLAVGRARQLYRLR